MVRKYCKPLFQRADNYQPSEMTLATLKKMEEKGIRRKKKPEIGWTESYIHDNTSPDYSWLLPGWLAEERVVVSNRLYKYYYDPTGRQYRAKYEVLAQWKKLELGTADKK